MNWTGKYENVKMFHSLKLNNAPKILCKPMNKVSTRHYRSSEFGFYSIQIQIF